MSDKAAFLRAIAAAPDDDGPRLVYADWLEENAGEPERAELIRVQCRLARMPRWEYAECKVCGATPDNEGEIRHGKGCYVLDENGGGSEGADETTQYKELSARATELLSQNAAFWGADLPIPALPQNGYAAWHRGFIADLSLTAADWLAHGDAILVEHPVRAVRFTTAPTFAGEWGRATDDDVECFTNARWPGVLFHLPPPTGGFLVPPQLAEELIGRLRESDLIIGDPVTIPFPTRPVTA